MTPAFPSPRSDFPAPAYGPWAVVTGASDGLGRATAVELAQRGYHLVLAARRHPELKALALQLDRDGIQTRVVAADLSTASGVERLTTATEELDVGLLVAAAGFGTSGAFLDNPLSAELSMLDVNCGAVVRLSHAFGRRFRARGRGGMVLYSSLLAFQGVPRAAHYAATKAFVQSLAEGLRHELAPHGVDVLAVAPGPVASGFARRADMRMGMALRPDTVARRSLSALGRRGTTRPGWLSWVLELALSTLPRWGRTRVLQQVMAGFTQHQGTAPRLMTPSVPSTRG